MPNDCYYVTAVYSFGVPLFLRGLTLAEATQVFKHQQNHALVTYAQFGVNGAMKPLGSWVQDAK